MTLPCAGVNITYGQELKAHDVTLTRFSELWAELNTFSVFAALMFLAIHLFPLLLACKNRFTTSRYLGTGSGIAAVGVYIYRGLCCGWEHGLAPSAWACDNSLPFRGGVEQEQTNLGCWLRLPLGVHNPCSGRLYVASGFTVSSVRERFSWKHRLVQCL